jgi:hypothetical protein
MTPTTTGPATFTEADRAVLIGIQVRLEYLVKNLDDQGGRIRALEADHASRNDLVVLEQRLGAVERHPLMCPILPRVQSLEKEQAGREERAKESSAWVAGLAAVARHGLIPAAMFLAGHLVWK